MNIYIAGKITGLDNFKELFDAAEKKLKEEGHKVMNPTILPKGFKWGEYMHVCFAMIDICDVVYLLPNWLDSEGAKRERVYAIGKNMLIRYETNEL